MDKFETTMANVRSSFRMLYVFNRRILDLMKYIGKKYNIPYKGGYSQFSNSSPRNNYGSLDNWAWHWLNMYLYEFVFFRDNTRLSIILQSDTGMWDSETDKELAIEKDKELAIEKFEKTEKSKTKLIFVFSNDNSSYVNLKKLYKDEYLKGEYTGTFETTENGKEKMYCMVFDINEFTNKKMTDASLTKFVKYLNSNDIFAINIVDDFQ